MTYKRNIDTESVLNSIREYSDLISPQFYKYSDNPFIIGEYAHIQLLNDENVNQGKTFEVSSFDQAALIVSKLANIEIAKVQEKLMARAKETNINLDDSLFLHIHYQ